MKIEQGFKALLLVLTIVSIFTGTATGANSVYVPDALQQWKPWVLEKHPDLSCPQNMSDSLSKRCVWLSELNLNINEKGAEFVLYAEAFADAQVEIPGDSIFWPCDVEADGKSVAVVLKNGVPCVDLAAGSWKIVGSLKWESCPIAIRIPQGTAIVNVQAGSKKISNPDIDQSGMLWFKALSDNVKTDSVSVDNVDVKVYRKVVDAIPLYMITSLKLIVSGNDRELLLGRFLPEKASPVYLHSTLPARIEPDGNVRVQVKAGTWIIEMKSRFNTDVNIFKTEQKSREWPDQEIWVFQSDSRLRTASVRGVLPIDPGQTGIPDEWMQLPTYLVGKGETFEIVEEHRGDFSPDPNVIRLDRKMWLDFKGKLFTVKDYISGSVSRSGRLSITPEFTLGSVSLDGVPQLVTTVDNASPGIEYRQGALNLECLSTVDKKHFKTTGWNQEFSSVNVDLHLPPGWSMLHLSGADTVHNSWLSKWTVWDIFLLLIIAISIAKILNVRWGVIAAIVFAVTFQEKGAPLFLWLNLVAAVAVVNVLPESKYKKIFVSYTVLSLIAITCVGIAFAVVQVRQALYPQLERTVFVSTATERSKQENDNVAANSVSSNLSYMPMEQKRMAQNLDVYDAGAKIQTGPGEPAWNWNIVSFNWSGPVESTQKIHMFLLSPISNSILSIVRVAGIILLLFGIGKKIVNSKNVKSIRSSIIKKAGKALLLFCGMVFLPVQASASDIPSKELLDELESRLTKEKPCNGECVAMQRGIVRVENESVTIELYLDAAMAVAYQLPGNRGSWFPEKVLMNGTVLPALSGTVDGGLEIALPQGHNKIVLTGRITTGRSEVQFPEKVNNMVAISDKWLVSGVMSGKIPGGVVKFEKAEKSSTPQAVQSKAVTSDQALPFVEVERNIRIDKEWTVTTIVRRIAPESDPVSLRIPLLQNESVISSTVIDPIGFITVYMTKDQQEFSWHSTLKMTSEIFLEVPPQEKWVEIWTLDPSPRWHVETSGLVQIKQDANINGVHQVWYPLPGEKVTIKVQKPQPVDGPTMTVQNVNVVSTPGRKTSSNTVEMTVLSSQADRLHVRFQSGSVLDGVSVDGVLQIVSLNENKLVVPLHPGTQTVSINWKTKNDLRFITRTPFIECGIGSANMNIKCTVPHDRWLLFAGGPMVGPALLFWPMLIVLLIVSIALGKLNNLPVRWYHWFLLFAGMSTVDNVGGVFVVVWFVVLAARSKISIGNKHFNLWQVGSIVLTVAAAGSLIATIPLGLLSTPDMQVMGNWSSSYALNWFDDITGTVQPQGWFISLPVWVYRLLMLCWSLWLALCLTKWIFWGWKAFSSGGLWKTKPKKIVVKQQ